MYCPKCKRIVDAVKCPVCKKATREPQSEDVCYLTEKPTPFAGMIQDVLQQNSIPCMLVSVMGAGLSAYVGNSNEIKIIYTNYSDLERARQLVDEIYGAPIAESDETDGDE